MSTDNELLAELHNELEDGGARIALLMLVLALVFLALFALWCWTQRVTP